MQNYEETLKKLKATAFDEIEKVINEENAPEKIGIRVSRIVNLTISLQSQIKK